MTTTQPPMQPKEYWDSVSSSKQFTTPFQFEVFEQYVSPAARVLDADYGTYGVFRLPEGATLRHHNEDYVYKLTTPFIQKEFEHLTFTTMNGNSSNGFYYIGEKPAE